jgi:hypothetical protein
MLRNTGARSQNEERRDFGYSNGRDDAFSCQRVQASSRICGNRVRRLKTADNADTNGDGIAACVLQRIACCLETRDKAAGPESTI